MRTLKNTVAKFLEMSSLKGEFRYKRQFPMPKVAQFSFIHSNPVDRFNESKNVRLCNHLVPV